jgi:hypothetical protein
VTATPPAPDPYAPLRREIGRYRRQFDSEPWTWRADPIHFPVLIRAMRQARRDGRPLTLDEASAITGVSPPPLGAIG